MVFLLGDRVYKAKKPIRTEFLDFRTVEARRSVCAREVSLNRRLAPDVYLGVIELADPAGGAGEPLVVMRRMPEDSRLSALVANGSPADALVDSIADVVARFHTSAARGPDIDRQGSVRAVRRRWCNNIRETRELDQDIVDPDRLDAIERRVLRFLDGRQQLFAQRIADARIVDGHADLLADDIFCLDDGPRILDCLEFDDDLRYVDGLDDVSCLAMDLEFQGRGDLADRFLDRYAALIDDPAPTALRHHYIAYRAFMRAKVDCVRYLQGRSESRTDALRHTELAEAHLEQGAVRLALVGGLPATGKSTVAERLAESVGAQLVSSDRVRRELFEKDRASDPNPGFRDGRYSAEATARVYATMLDRARRALERGESVVLDASWTDRRLRGRAAELAGETLSELVSLQCTADSEIAERRLRRRVSPRSGHAGTSADSEATPAIARAMARAADAWPEATDIDTAGPVEQSVRAATEQWWRLNPTTSAHVPRSDDITK
ncbi:AAA family ATPase [Rhodococcus sp. ABRD24]|uniref:bifunctional aminoglycoside phosphotransferase/ATP-binding protein n=1 Tax=Rhodococcus sp. ABRD24 TaxID=2507582 RepID=UPI001F600979|nr:AAA family ATPase [Rhodococcus sp. ABRD24]